jgi:hypothetical protein
MNNNIPPIPLLDSSLNKKEQKIIKNLKDIPCSSLSKKKCNENKECSFNENLNICEPTKNPKFSNFYFSYKDYWITNSQNTLSSLNSCEIEKYIENIKIYSQDEKNSSSNSVIVSGLLDPTQIDKKLNIKRNLIIKCSFEPKNPLDNSLDVEISIYKNIISKLVNNKNTPCLVSYLFNKNCNAITYKPLFLEMKDNINIYQHNTKKINFLFLELSNGVKYQEYFTSQGIKDNFSSFISSLFQIFYTLHCFNNIGLRHNDLHFGNIFVEKLIKPMVIYFNIPEIGFVELYTDILIKIYDFDRSSIIYPGIPRNYELDLEYCEEYHTCNTISPKFDTFKVVSQFVEILKHEKEISIFSNEIIDLEWLKDLGKNYDMSFKFLPKKINPTEQELKSNLEILKILLNNYPNVCKMINNIEIPYVYKPPEKREIKYIDFHPESKQSNYLFSSSYLNNSLEIFNIYNIPNITPFIIQTNKEELRKNERILYFKFAEKYNEFKMLNKNSKIWFKIGCRILCIPEIHELSEKMLETVTSKKLDKIIPTIMNVFDNRLPITLKKMILI